MNSDKIPSNRNNNLIFINENFWGLIQKVEFYSIRMGKRVLEQDFYARDTKLVARELLGCLLVSTIAGKKAAGIIVETEAYLAKNDSACHGVQGMNRKNATMFDEAGRAYVYPIHAKHCFNCVTQAVDQPTAVLIRAIQPMVGIPIMKERRTTDKESNLCSGPAKLCQSLAIDRQSDGLDLTLGQKIWIEQSDNPPNKIKQTTRIGVTSAENLKLRFVIAGSAFASGPKYMR